MATTFEDERDAALAEVERLKSAIRNHRDQRGNDRCHIDDSALYEALGEPQPNTALPPREAFLAECARFYECRQKPGDVYMAHAKAARDQLLSVAPFVRRAMETAKENGTLELAVVSTQPDGGGKIVARFSGEFFNDVMTAIDAPPDTEEQQMEAKAQELLDRLGLRDGGGD